MSENNVQIEPQINAKIVEYDMQNGTHVVQQRFYNENGKQLKNNEVREAMAPGVENLFSMLAPNAVTEVPAPVEAGVPDTAPSPAPIRAPRIKIVDKRLHRPDTEEPEVPARRRSKNGVIIVDKRRSNSDENEGTLGSERLQLSDGTTVIDRRLSSSEATSKKGLRARVRARWNDIRVRGRLLASGDIRGAVGNEHGKLLSNKRMLGAAAVAGVVAFAWANNKHGWGIDINPFDGDGLDLNPFNNSHESITEVVDAAESPEAALNPEVGMTTVHVDPGEGTSHIARDVLGINFDTAEQWNEFNAATNPLFEGVDGVYKDVATGEWRISNPGTFEIPQSIPEKMQRTAQEIKAKS